MSRGGLVPASGSAKGRSRRRPQSPTTTPRERVRRLERRLAEEVAISDIQRRLLACMEVEQAAVVLLETVPELSAAERCRLAVRLESGSWRCWDRTLGEPIQSYDLGPEARFPEKVLADKEAVLCPECPPDRAPRVELASRLRLESYMALPVATPDRQVGVLEAVNFVHPEGLEEYADVVAEVLVAAAIAIEFVRLHEEVRQKAEELGELLQNLEDFSRMVSHDLRTPLTVVLGQAQLAERALRAGQKETVGRSLAAIGTGARRMNSMIQDLGDVARIETGALELRRQPLSLVDFVADLRERMAGLVEADRIEVVPPAGPLPKVLADPDRLERILTNLLSNALKYSKGKVTVGFEPRQGEVVTTVTDRGIGVAPEDLPWLFERFYRAKGVRQAEGLGLGLFITRMLVEAHGGRIWAESEPARGSTFCFTLPVAAEPI